MSDFNMEVDSKDLERFSGRLLRFIPGMVREHQKIIDEQSLALRDLVRHFASGNGEGPQIVTGQYVKTINVGKFGTGWKVYSTAPQARRLEYGFVGQDSLGRDYNQRPRPHWRPAIVIIRTQTVLRMRAAPMKVWRSSK